MSREQKLAGECRDDEVKRGRGRPKTGTARNKISAVRFDDEERAMIEHLEIETGMNLTEIVRKALRTYYPIQVKKL